MTIGQVAKAAGLRASAIRYYEEAGLLPPPPRAGGRRHYDSKVLERLALLEFAKQCGFRLAEVKGLLRGFGDDVPLGQRLQNMAERKLAELDRDAKTIALRKTRIERALACRCVDIGECCRRILARRKS
jgi:MerR family transcriptional regulator, redox-sensitive transcriptional activator SoxR